MDEARKARNVPQLQERSYTLCEKFAKVSRRSGKRQICESLCTNCDVLNLSEDSFHASRQPLECNNFMAHLRCSMQIFNSIFYKLFKQIFFGICLILK